MAFNPGGKKNPGPGAMLSSGFELAVGMGLGAVVGTWIDHRHHSEPKGLLVGVGIGFVAGMYLLVKDLFRMNRR